MEKIVFVFILLFNSMSIVQSQSNALSTLIGKRIGVSKRATSHVDTIIGVQFNNTSNHVESRNYKPPTDTLFIIRVGEPVFIAKYEVIAVLQGCVPTDTIHVIFDHSMATEKIESENELLFLNNAGTDYSAFQNGQKVVYRTKNNFLFLDQEGMDYFIFQKQRIAVYKTKNNRWAIPYSAIGSDRMTRGDSHRRPRRIRFKSQPCFDVNLRQKDAVKQAYPSPYYKINGNRVFPMYGIYVEDLVESTLGEPKKIPVEE